MPFRELFPEKQFSISGNNEIPHLFERFFRSENSDKNSTVIGLAISKEIVEKHHGIISAQNTAEGLMVSMWLPIVEWREAL